MYFASSKTIISKKHLTKKQNKKSYSSKCNAKQLKSAIDFHRKKWVWV